MNGNKQTVYIIRADGRWLVHFPGDTQLVTCHPQSEEKWMMTVRRLLKNGYNVIELNPREGIIRIPS